MLFLELATWIAALANTPRKLILMRPYIILSCLVLTNSRMLGPQFAGPIFDAELDLADARSNRLRSVVEAYRALGGGWI
jgi:hypothetical protein